MLWQEDENREIEVPERVVDVNFRINTKCIPLEHAWLLSTALRERLPWLEEEEHVAIHTIHGPESGNGWFRPDDAETELLYVSRRTRMTLRLPVARVEEAIGALEGKPLRLGSFELLPDRPSVHPLSKSSTLFSRHVVTRPEEPEEEMVQRLADELQEMGIRVKKLLCGRESRLHHPQGEVLTRSVMVADLRVDEAVRLQERGLGPQRLMGCGIFIPHKDITTLND